MEEILCKLLVPNNESIEVGTAELKERLKSSSSAVGELCTLLVSDSSSPQIRQYSAVVLSRVFSKAKKWLALSDSERESVKIGLLEASITEPVKSVKKSIIHAIGVIAVIEIPSGNWPQLNQFLNKYLQGDGDRKFGLWAYSIILDVSGEEFRSLFKDSYPVFICALQNTEDVEAGYYAILCLLSMVQYIGVSEVREFQSVVEPVLGYLRTLITVDQEKATESFEILNEFFDSEVSIITYQIQPIVDLCLNVAKTPSLSEELRVQSVSVIGQIVKSKKKTIVKSKLYLPIIDVLFPLLCDPDDCEDDDDLENEDITPAISACQTLDVMAINLPPIKFISAIMAHINSALESGENDKIRGALTAMAVISEGCSEYIRTKHLSFFLQTIGSGISGNYPHNVKSSAFSALAQISEYLQPDISNYSHQILPVLLELLDSVIKSVNEDGPELKGLRRLLVALEVYCKNLDEKITPFLPDLMKRVLSMANEKYSIDTQKLVLSVIRAAIESAESEILPCLDSIMNILKKYLVYDSENDNNNALLTQSMYTLGAIARNVDASNISPSLAEDCMSLGLRLIAEHDDPDVRTCSYALFGAVSYIVKEQMASSLPKLVELMLKSLTSTEGIVLQYKDEESSFILDDDEDDVEEILTQESVETDTKDTLKSVKNVDVENSFMEEKEQAILTLRELCENVGPAFNTYISTVTEEVFMLMEYPQEDIRQAAIEAMATFVAAAQNPEEVLEELIPNLCEIISSDTEVLVVSKALETIAEVLKSCEQDVLQSVRNHTKYITNCVQNVLNKTGIACIDTSNEIDDEDEEDEAEQEELLLDCAGEIIPALGNVLDPPSFVRIFQDLLPFLMKKTVKSHMVGCIAESMKPLTGVLEPFVPILFDYYGKCLSYENVDVRNNSIFGLGEMALHGGQCVIPLYPNILKVLTGVIANETSPRVIDQVVGAVCRLILSSPNNVPIDEVFPSLQLYLPLKEDHDEYDVVFKMLIFLLEQKSPHVVNNLKHFVDMANTINPKKVSNMEELKPLVEKFIHLSQMQ